MTLGKDGWGSGKKRDDVLSKAVKVVDLLEHAIELGHVDAMYKLAQISLVSCQAHFPGHSSLNQRTVPT